MTSTQNVAAHVGAAISIPAWLVSIAENTLPLVQWFAGFVAIISGGLAIVLALRKLRGGKP